MCRPAIAVVAALALGTVLPGSLLARCGVERWSVKTGTDPGASSVDLARPTPSTLAKLTALASPPDRPDDARVAPFETSAWIVEAQLVEFKFESSPRSGDSDYHLVLRDEQGRTMIAEIPSPTCVGEGSPFRDAISAARDTFNAHFQAGSAFETADVPVRITGVGFFDFDHGQRGRAPNDAELHPVLAIEFNPSEPGVASGPSLAGSGIQNGDFELTPDSGNEAPGWSGTSNVSGQNVIIAGGSFPHSGQNYVVLGNANNLEASLGQTFVVPRGASLSFSVNVVTREPLAARAHDELTVEAHDASGQNLVTLVTLSNRDATRSSNRNGKYFEVGPLDLSAFAGQSVQLIFRVRSNPSRPTLFRIDDISLEVSQ